MRLTTAEKREIGEEFIEYLTENNLLRTWHRSDLKHYYNIFNSNRKQEGLETVPYSQALFVLARFGRKELAVRNGTTVVFRGTSGFNYRKPIPVAKRVTSDFVDVVPIGEQVTAQPLGYITRQVSNASSMDYNWIEIELRNKSSHTIRLDGCTLLSRKTDFHLEWANSGISSSNNHTILVKPLRYGEVQTTEIEITLEIGYGRSETFIHFLRFQDVSESAVQQTLDDIDLEITNPKKRNLPGSICTSFAGYIRGEPPESLHETELKMTWPLDYTKIPTELKSAWERGIFKSPMTSSRRSDVRMHEDFVAKLSICNFSIKFKMLIHVEELQNCRDIKRYDIGDGKLSKEGKLFYLEVPGLAEKRPSVLRGDKVYVKPMSSPEYFESTSYQGYVHLVEQKRIGLGFNSQLSRYHLANKRYYVRFDFNRLALKLLHRASQAILSRPDSTEILFPTRAGTYCKKKPLKLYNRIIEENVEQKNAIEMIASGETSKVYIIFGPPGTGKTITMVEAIHQLLNSSRNTHMLMCAPSNSACDLLTERLLQHADKRQIFRMHAASRNWTDVPDVVKEVSNYNGYNRKFFFPSQDELIDYRIIVTTLITAGRIASAQFPNDHFNYVFIDEAGQAMEPEIMVAVSGVLAENGKIILAGDPKQLGPIIRSSEANENGLQLSYLERLMTTSQIHTDVSGRFDPTCVVKLLKNYRSHESIIHVSNELFYKNELEVCADEITRNSLCSWDELPKEGFPVIFHGVQGEDKREPKSPSFFNPQEIKKVMSYVDSLLDTKRNRISAREIGVITPYRKQVQKIRESLSRKDPRSEIKVGSVEEFQGQERRVIILSTVRSNTEHLQHDAKFNLGFLRNPKRINVAVTRAKALMIIIGNPRILCLDKCWRALLQHCLRNGGYTGIPFKQRDLDQCDDKQADQLLREEDSDISDEDDSLPQIDKENPQWRQDP